MAILSEKQIAAIKKHRYSVEGTSIMDFLDVLYLWMAKKIHHRVTANLVTIIGLVSVVLSCSFVAYFSYIGDHQSLQSSGYLCAFGLLMWMSCDSIDGKVARLRDLCSPFGEILDHGGDAFALMMSSVALACILGVTDTPLGTVAWILCDMAAYYFSEPYTIYVCGQSRIESFDFYEFLTLYIGICLSHATFGKEIWQYTSFWHSIAPVIPVFIILTSASIAFVSVSQEVLKENAILFGLCFGFCFAKIHIQLIIATGLDAMIYFIRLLHQLYHSLGETLFLLDHNRNQCKKSNGFSK
eukprot:gene861-10610_t